MGEQVNKPTPEAEEEFARYAELNARKVAQLGLAPDHEDWEISEEELVDLRRQVALEQHEERVDSEATMPRRRWEVP